MPDTMPATFQDWTARTQAADIDGAVRHGRAAFDDGLWSRLPPAQRKQVLLRMADAVEAARDDLALLECLEVGKPITKAVQADVAGTVRCLRWCAEAADKVYGEVAPTGPNALATITREAMGVIGCIVPWNDPLLMAAWKLGPALVTGNSVVLKPSEKSPLSALRLADLAVAAGLPRGVLNVVPGHPLDPATAMGALIDEGELRRVLDVVRGGLDNASLLCGGARADVAHGGSFLQPTVVAGVSPRAPLARDEIFGPVVCLLRFAGEAQAIALANDSDDGLQASVWSADLSRAHRVARALRAGTVPVNQDDDDDMTVPFGGDKQSGNGHDKSLHALDKDTELKTTWVHLDD
jgi:acyl-CoA reductase-like NAD-dependent aldehyde dehydrogenase